MLTMRIEEAAEMERIELRNCRSERPMVSIWCLTYNHKEYIKKALEGFINQKTNFNYEIVIYDDASTDGTTEIIREYASRYPNLIRAHLAHKNIYHNPHRNEMMLEYKEKELSGKYVAICEGDDYWIYDYKLQKQYDWMEEHPNATLCLHNSIRYNKEIDEVIPQIIDRNTGYFSKRETFFCDYGNVPTASFFCRGKYFRNIPKSVALSPVGDDPLRWWLAYNGDIYYMDKLWSVRNYMHKGSWNYSMREDSEFKEKQGQKFMEFLFGFDKDTNYEFHTYIQKYENAYCKKNIFFRLKENYNCQELADRIETCKQKCTDAAKAMYEKNLYIYQKGCVDYLDKVYECAKKNKGYFYIYGAGIEAQKYAQMLNKNGIEFSGFVVSDKGKNQMELAGHTVITIEEIVNPEEVWLWLCMNQNNCDEVLECLLPKKLYNII